jgi:hypothetical protein
MKMRVLNDAGKILKKLHKKLGFTLTRPRVLGWKGLSLGACLGVGTEALPSIW